MGGDDRQQRVAVGGRLGRHFRPEIAAGTAAVVDNDVLPEDFTQFRRDRPGG